MGSSLLDLVAFVAMQLHPALAPALWPDRVGCRVDITTSWATIRAGQRVTVSVARAVFPPPVALMLTLRVRRVGVVLT